MRSSGRRGLVEGSVCRDRNGDEVKDCEAPNFGNQNNSGWFRIKVKAGIQTVVTCTSGSVTPGEDDCSSLYESP